MIKRYEPEIGSQNTHIPSIALIVAKKYPRRPRSDRETASMTEKRRIAFQLNIR